MKYTAKERTSLLEALGALAPEASKTTLRSWIKEGRILLDGEPLSSPTEQVEPGQVVSLAPKARYTKNRIRLIYEDHHLVIVDKPIGLLTVATAFEKGETVHAFLKSHFKPGRVYVVHRLDQDTSGVMFFARSEKMKEALKALLEKHAVDRVYHAVVEGCPEPLQGTWESYQIEDGNYLVHNVKEEVSGGKRAVTHYKVLDRSKKYALLELRLETGRKNQIRAHCKMAGTPIVGDKKYGARSNPLKRLGLHATLLGFINPVTGKQMEFSSPMPKSFELNRSDA
jgi:23S rRNA pseudouridine1911/1915/1917 synthase